MCGCVCVHVCVCMVSNSSVCGSCVSFKLADLCGETVDQQKNAVKNFQVFFGQCEHEKLRMHVRVSVWRSDDVYGGWKYSHELNDVRTCTE